MLIRSRVVGALASFGLLAATHAQEEMNPIGAPEDEALIEQQQRQAGAWRWTLDLYGRYGFEADLETSGDVTTGRTGAIVGTGGRLGERGLLRINIRTETSTYDFEGAGALGTGPDGPLDNGYDISIRPVYIHQVNQEWGWVLSPFFRFSGEKDVSFSEAIQYGGFAGARHVFSEQFNLTLGIGAQTRFEDSALVIPYIAFEWNPSETLSVESDGLGVTATRRLNDEWAARVFARWEPRDFRLADDGPIPDGVLRDEEVLVGVGLTWTPSQRATLVLNLGATVYRELETLNDSGRTIEREEADPAPYIGARFTWAF